MPPLIFKPSFLPEEILPMRSLTRSLRLGPQRTAPSHRLPTPLSQHQVAHRLPSNEGTIAKQNRRGGGFHNGGTPPSATTSRAARARALVCGGMSSRRRLERLAASRERSFRAIRTGLFPATLVAAI